MFEFSWPWAFLLVPLPFILLFLKSTVTRLTIKAPSLIGMPQSRYGAAKKARVSLLGWLCWLCLCSAVANPKYYGDPISLPLEGRDLMLAVDLSGSMEEADMAYQGQYIDRLSLVKAVLSEFITARKGDRLGLILFGDTAFLQTPLTRDVTTVSQMLVEAQIGLVGKATAIGDALGLAVKRFKLKEDSNRILILLTDGQNTSGNLDPEEALILAKEEGIKVYTVGVGSNSSNRGFFSMGLSRGSSLDETLLKKIASETGGKYFRATDAQTLQSIYSELDRLEPLEDDQQTFRPQSALFYYPLGVIILLICLSLLWQIALALRPEETSHD